MVGNQNRYETRPRHFREVELNAHLTYFNSGLAKAHVQVVTYLITKGIWEDNSSTVSGPDLKGTIDLDDVSMRRSILQPQTQHTVFKPFSKSPKQFDMNCILALSGLLRPSSSRATQGRFGHFTCVDIACR